MVYLFDLLLCLDIVHTGNLVVNLRFYCEALAEPFALPVSVLSSAGGIVVALALPHFYYLFKELTCVHRQNKGQTSREACPLKLIHTFLITAGDSHQTCKVIFNLDLCFACAITTM